MIQEHNYRDCCPLCFYPLAEPFFRDHRRCYQQCDNCLMVSVPTDFYIDEQHEKAQYDLHQNNPEDAGYRRFLNRLALPLANKLQPHSLGLDFGCGPGPTLSVILGEMGHSVDLYDIYYHPNSDWRLKQYDFITSTEVVEHLSQPRQVLDRLWQVLKAGGWLGLMTKRIENQQAFKKWHYKNDPTHICFFHQQSFHYLAEQWGALVEFVDSDVVFLYKP